MSQGERYRPRLFIGSSREGLPIANAIHTNLTREAECTVWNSGFNLSVNILENLIKILEESDFGVFVFSPDDTILMRGNLNSTARDNVIFELGLFIGRLGLERSFFATPDNATDLKLPTDLEGITHGTYEATRTDGSWIRAVNPLCMQIMQQMLTILNAQHTSSQSKSMPISPLQHNYVEGERKPETPSEPDSQFKNKNRGEGIKASKYKNGMYIIKGDTINYREILKSVGAKWNRPLSAWLINQEKMPDILQKLPNLLIKSEPE